MTPEHVREHARRAREDAQRILDAVAKARLHEIANILERVAEELERHSDPERRS